MTHAKPASNTRERSATVTHTAREWPAWAKETGEGNGAGTPGDYQK